jgi:hypothetical protein
MSDKTLDDARKLVVRLRDYAGHAAPYDLMRDAADYIEAVIAASVPSGAPLTDAECDAIRQKVWHERTEITAGYFERSLIRAGAASMREGAVPRIATGAMSRAGDEKLWAYHVEGTDPDVSALWTVMHDAAPREPAKAEPVAWMYVHPDPKHDHVVTTNRWETPAPFAETPLYTREPGSGT